MLSEFELIRRYFTYPAPHTRLGVGDDAAVVRLRRGMELVVSTDMLLSGRHFFHDADPRRLGHKALAVNLSDMAAMGATPRWVTLSLALPRADTTWLQAFTAGFMQLARQYGVDLIGGDTTRGPLTICVQIMGEVPSGKALRRDGARAGDDVWVSGNLGDAALALAARSGRLRLAAREFAAVSRRLDLPLPRIELGEALRATARSAIDISDGLLADLGHICERSRVGAVIELAHVPRSTIMERYVDRAAGRAALLSGGDDYELCFTAPRSRRSAVERIARRSGLKVTRIGRIITARRGTGAVAIIGKDGKPVVVRHPGFDHFG